MSERSLDELVLSFAQTLRVDSAAREFYWWRLIDTIASSSPTPGLLDYDLGGAPTALGATSWQSGRGTLPAEAAFNNAHACHRSEFDDTVRESAMHSSGVVLPAMIALAESRNDSMARLLEAFAVGGEVLVRLSWGIGPELNARGFHATGVLGAYGVAIGGARLMRLDAQTTLRALSLLSSMGAGVGQYRVGGGDTKGMHAAWAAKIGIEALNLGIQGMTGPAGSLDGPFGILATHLGFDFDLERTRIRFEDVRAEWSSYSIRAKRYPVCHFLQPVIDCATQLRDRLVEGRGVGAVRRVTVTVPEDALRTVAEPRAERLNYLTCIPQLSAYLVTAAALIDGRIDMRSFTTASLERDEVVRLASVTDVVPLAVGPQADDYPGGVQVELEDGTVLGEHLDGLKPLGPADLEAKFRDACAASGRNPRVIGMSDDEMSVRDFVAAWLSDGNGARAGDQNEWTGVS